MQEVSMLPFCRIAATLFLVVLVPVPALADGGDGSDPDDPESKTQAYGHAPIGVMGDHLHKAGEWMLSYRFMHMRMKGNQDGTNHKSVQDVFDDGFMVAPTWMNMDMHMFGLMYAPTDWLTMMAMIPYIDLEMKHQINNPDATTFKTKSNGAGDFKLSGLLKLFEVENHKAHLNLGLSFPTGSISEKDKVPVPMMGFQKKRLPYPMQLGSGTYDWNLGATYNGDSKWVAWGAQAMGVVRMDENSKNYRKGDEVDLTAWLAVPINRFVSPSARIRWSWWGNYSGRDKDLNPAAVPTADPDRRKGNRLDLLGGVNFLVDLGSLGEHRIAVEGGGPVHQWLDGPQLRNRWHVTVGWQKAFSSIWPF
jgi:hypothetical protein